MEKGQAILGLILIMVIALGIGLSVVQKSLVDISTSSKVEESSRAFSAAEAGIEKALRGDRSQVDFVENNSRATITDTGLLPAIPASGPQGPLEYPPLSKEEVAHFWLADPEENLPNCTTVCYAQSTLDIYWGNSSSDKASLEVTLVYYDGGYKSKKWYFYNGFESSRPQGFEQIACSTRCEKRLDFGLLSSARPILLRARLLYNSTSQPIAIQGVGGNIPPQAKLIKSIGISGETQRAVQVFQIEKVVPPYFDYAIFSAGDISK